jgi:GNAT superfamily N-acetyltransferase
MDVVVREEPGLTSAALAAHAAVPISFLVERVVRVSDAEGGRGPLVLGERPVAKPYPKDYDAIAPPAEWPRQFDVSRWGLLGAFSGRERVGGAVVVSRERDVHLLEGRDDLAVVWDLRVAPGWRGRGVGTALFTAAERWATGRGARELLVETQDTNAPACAFYARRGCRLRTARRGAYAGQPDELQLLWVKALPGAPPA